MAQRNIDANRNRKLEREIVVASTFAKHRIDRRVHGVFRKRVGIEQHLPNAVGRHAGDRRTTVPKRGRFRHTSVSIIKRTANRSPTTHQLEPMFINFGHLPVFLSIHLSRMKSKPTAWKPSARLLTNHNHNQKATSRLHRHKAKHRSEERQISVLVLRKQMISNKRYYQLVKQQQCQSGNTEQHAQNHSIG